MLKLALEEQETSISQMADNRDEWVIVTDDEVWKARLKKMGFKPTREHLPTQWFTVPATCVIVRKAPNIKPLSEEQREKRREEMRVVRSQKKAHRELEAG